MKKMAKLAVLLAAAVAARAEYLRIEQTFGGMECASCIEFVKGRLSKRPGVESVTVDEKAGGLVVTLAAGNKLRLRQVTDMVQQSGFTPKQTKVVVRGVVGSDAAMKVLETESLILQGVAAGKVKAGNAPTTVVGIVKTIPSIETAGTLEIERIDPAKP